MNKRIVIGIFLFILIAGIGIVFLLEKPDVQESRTEFAYSDGGDENSFLRAQPNPLLRFPEDHGSHNDYQTEWWYFTGNLDAMTMPGFFAARYGSPQARIFSAAVTGLFLVIYNVSVLKGMANAFEVLMDLPYWAGVVISGTARKTHSKTIGA